MKYEIVNEFPHEIIYDRTKPCISIYLPTTRVRPNTKDYIVFKNLVQSVENSLKLEYSQKEIDNFIKPLIDIGNDRLFWNKTKDGLVMLLNPNNFVIYNLNRPVEELAIVSDSFHIKPLIRVYQSADSYYVLGVNRKTFKLFYGNRYGLEEISFDEDVPVSIEDVLGEELTEPHLSYGSYGGASANAMYHGHGGRKVEVDKDTQRYFQYVDKFIIDNFSNPSKAPLVLVALDEHQGLFRKLSKNNYLIDEGVHVDFETLDNKEIRKRSWDIIEKQYLQRTKDLIDRYNVNLNNKLATDNVNMAAKRAVEGAVETLLVESDKLIPGKVDLKSGELIVENLENPNTDDILDDLVEIVLHLKGEVVMLPKERMPTNTGIAAILRY